MKRKVLPLFLIFYLFQGILFAQTADLAITNFVTSKDTVSTLETIQLQITVENKGVVQVNSSKVKYYLSEDTIFSSGDFYFGDQSISGLSASQTTSAAGDKQIPSDIYTGYWYILAVANDDLNIDESNFTNNMKYSRVYVNQSPSSDIYLSQISFADSITAGENLSYNFTVQNLGEVNTSTFYTGIYLSLDTIFDVTDVKLAENYMSSLASNGNFTKNASVKIPVERKGNFYLICIADNRLSVFEKNEFNNIAYKKLYIKEAPTPDLTISEVSSPQDSVIGGAQLELNYVVKNIGEANAGNFSVGYYISNDANFDEKDAYLTSSTIYGLNAVNGMESKVVHIPIPDTCSDGMKYIFLKADNQNTIPEKNENNNSILFSINVKKASLPDLTITNVYFYFSEDSITAGNDLKTACNVQNIGGVAAPSSNLGIYLSKDDVYDENDVYLGSERIEALSASQKSLTRFPTVKIPDNTSAGTWYVLFYIDDNQEINETDESNNTEVDSVYVSAIPVADLIVNDNPKASKDSIKADNSLDVSCVVKNIGEAQSDISYVGYYLSKDTLLDDNDVFLNETQVGILPATVGTSSLNETVRIPIQTKEGDYYVVLVADYSNLVSEADENNNTNYLKIYVKQADLPDLTVSDVNVVPDTLKQGENLTLSAIVKNIGKLNSNATTLLYALSKDTIYQDSLDGALKEVNIGALNSIAGQMAVTNTLTIPTDAELGQSYILLFVDNKELLIEAEELNNFAHVQIQIEAGPSPDLLISDLALTPDSLKPGEKLSLQYIVNNLGDLQSPISYTKFYLSDDAILDSTDLYVSSQKEPSLAAVVGKQSNDISITIPDTAYSGQKYIIIQADGKEEIDESNEQNNTASIVFYIKMPDLCDLFVKASFSPVELLPGEKITTGIEVHNEGKKTAPASQLAYYLSRDSVLDLEDDTIFNTPKDIFLTTFSIDTIVVGGVVAKNGDFYLPDTISSGTWYIVSYIDYNKQIREMNEENNTGFKEITVNEPPKPDLIPSVSSIIPMQVQAGSNVSFISLVKNIGQGKSASSHLSFYLSLDNKISDDDISLGTSTVPPLSEVGLETITKKTTIPYQTKPGTWYCIVYSDEDSLITESNEDNNMAYKSFTITAPPYPDILVKSASLNPIEQTAGQDVTYSCVVQNIGDTSAMNVSIRHYISNDTLFDSKDIVLNQNDYVDVGNGKLATVTGANLTIPHETESGNKFILFVADPDSTLLESDKSNNVAYASITILSPPRPDWAMISSTIFPDMVDINVKDNDFVVRYKLENKGDISSNRADIVFYLSKDTLYSQNDILVSSQSISGLSVGQKLTNSYHLNIADTVNVGNWYLLTYIDGYRKFTELSEDNNINYNAIKIVKKVPDLHPLGTQLLPYTIYVGETVNSSCLIENRDLGNASRNYLSLYLSNDTIKSADDLSIENAIIPNLSSGKKTGVPVSFKLSGNIAEGNYYLLFSVDDSSSVYESDESNNVIYHAFNLKKSIFPDLMFSKAINLSAGAYYPDSTLSYSFSVKNAGNSIADNISYDCYLSHNDTLDMDDELIHSDVIERLYTNSELTISADYQLENKFDDGHYFLFVVLDKYNNIVESNDSNNIASIEFEISHNAAVPDIKEQTKVNLYPNPVTQNLSINLSNEFYGEFDIAIYDLSEKLAFKQRANKLLGNYHQAIDVSNLKPGIYFMRIRFDDYFIVKKFAKY